MTKNLTKLMIFIVFTVAVFTTTAIAQNWQKIGGTNPYINDIYVDAVSPDLLIVASDAVETIIDDASIFPSAGNGYLISTNRGQSFDDYRLVGYSVQKIFKSSLNPNTMYASVAELMKGYMARSYDGGETWTTDEYGCKNSYQALDMIEMSNDEHLLVSAVNSAHGIVFTEDGFENCYQTEELEIQSRCLAKDNQGGSTVLFGADGKYASGVWTFINATQSWEQRGESIKDYRVLSIVPSLEGQDIFICGLDSIATSGKGIGKGIYRTTDAGMTWEFTGGYGLQVYDIAQHPEHPEYMAAACGEDGVWISSKYGKQWEPSNNGMPEGFVNKVAIPNWAVSDDGFQVLASVYGDGLYQSDYLIAGVNENNGAKDAIYSLYPQPANSQINISWDNPIGGSVEFAICDMLGNPVMSMSRYLPAGAQVVQIPLGGEINSGVYMLRISSGEMISTRKIIIQK
ncbi:MAG: T9SS type A sorting domain-containing protein [Candidatus Kapaibacterium sp.]